MAKIHFKEEYSWEKGFNLLFNKKITPHLLYVETIRRTVILLIVLLVSSFYLSLEGSLDLNFKVLILYMIIGLMVTLRYYIFYVKNIKKEITPHLLNFMSKGIHYSRKQNYINTKDLKMFFNDFNYISVDDVFYRNKQDGFVLSEFNLIKEIRYKKTINYKTMFQGVFFNIFAENLPFILVKERPLLISDNKYKGHSRMVLEDPVFENIYDSYCDDQIAARKVFEPKIIEKILELGITSQFINKNILDLSKIIKNDYKSLKREYAPRLLFNKNGVNIILPSKKNLFEPVPLFRNAATDKNIKLVLYQLYLVLEIIELVKTKIINKNN